MRGLNTLAEPCSLTGFGRLVLSTACPTSKANLTHSANEKYRTSDLPIGSDEPPEEPSRPEKPTVVKSFLPSAKELGVSNAVYYLHSLAHVELNAIDLAWDTMLRFGKNMPTDWFSDWLHVASDESRHFLRLDAALKDLKSSYGELPAHSIVWDGARSTKADLAERLVIGNLVQEARGLDAGPRLVGKLVSMGFLKCASIVEEIAEEEKDHVRFGMKWFLKECQRLGPAKSPKERFRDIAMLRSNKGAFSPPFNVERRREVGLEPEWYLPVAKMMKEMMKKDAMSKQNTGKTSCSA